MQSPALHPHFLLTKQKNVQMEKMGSETPRKLPVIDFSKKELKSETSEWESVKSQVRQALEEYGCFEAIFTTIPLDLRTAVFGALEELFDLPLETKSRNLPQNPFHGYSGQFPTIPLYESLGIEGSNMSENVESITNTWWPQGNPNFSKTIHSFSVHVSELEQIVRKMVLESLGVGKYFEEQMESTKYILRVMKYKGPKTSETELGLSPHTDLNIMTILYQNQVNGLEVRTTDGEWINVKSSPDKFTVTIGDAFHVWTNGRMRPAIHRVMMSGTETRYSTGLFSFPKAECMVKTPKELVDDDHPLLFKPFHYDEYAKFVYANVADGDKKDTSFLKPFCGV